MPSARSDEARTALEDAEDTLVALGSPPRTVAELERARGSVEQAVGRHADAVADFDRALAALRAGHLLDDPRAEEQYFARVMQRARGASLLESGRLDEATRGLAEALAAARAATPPLDVEIAGALDDLGRARLATDDPGAAHALHAEAAERVLHALGDGSHSTGLVFENLGADLVRLGRFDEAARAYRRAAEVFRRAHGATHPAAARATIAAVDATLRAGGATSPEAREALRRALDDAEVTLRGAASEPPKDVGRRAIARARLTVLGAPRGCAGAAALTRDARRAFELAARSGLVLPDDRPETVDAFWAASPCAALAPLAK